MNTTQEYIDDIAEFQRIAKTIEGYNPKRLLDDEGNLISKVIEANGNNYIVLNEREGYTVDRFRKHLALQQMLANAKSLEQIVLEQNKSRELVQEIWEGKAPFSKLATHLEKIFENYFKDSQNREHIALYECTLFIVKEGSSLNTWSFEEANLWIKDWIKEGIYVPDFFTLALRHSPNYIEILKTRIQNGYETRVKNKKHESSGNTE